MFALAMIGGIATLILFRHYRERSLVKANTSTIILQAAGGLLLVIGLALSTFIPHF